MKKIILMAAMVAVASLSSYAQTVDEIVNKNIVALGGKEKLYSLKSVKIDAVIKVQNMDLPSTIVQLANVGMRTDFTVQGMKGTQVVTKNDGWSFMPFMGQDKPVATSPDDVKQAQSDLDLAGPLVDYAKKGNKVELAGKEAVEGKDAFKLKVTMSDGSASEIYIDPVTGYTVKSVIKRKMNGQEAVITTLMSDYRKTEEGYVFPYKLNQQIPNGPGLMDITVSKIETNKPVDESIFEMP